MEPASLAPEAARVRLAATGWLAACPADFAHVLLDAASIRHLKTCEPLYAAGDTQGGIWGIAQGQLGGFSGVNSATAPLSVMFMPGEWGGTGPLTGYSRLASVVACAPSTIMVVPLARVNGLLHEHSAWWEHFSRLHFLMAIKFGMLAVDLQIADSRTRLAAIVLNATGLRQGGDEPASIAITQEQLGVMANLSRHPAGQILRQLAREGLLMVRYGRMTVLQPAALRAVANAA